nr:CoA pyrophosphatase [Oceanococcus sp. HetDA_MAG_MS8]
MSSAPAEHLSNSELSHRLQACLKPLDTPAPRQMVDLGVPSAVDKLLGNNWSKRLKPAAVLVAVRRTWPDPRVVLTVRTRQLRTHAGQISFPGGRADADDHFPLGTALREAEEETGLRAHELSPLGLLDDYPTVSKYRVTPVVAWLEEGAGTHPHQAEVEEIFEVPLRHLLDPRRYKISMMAKLGVPMAEFQHGRYRIWGATAGMLWNLQERFHATLEQS